MDKGASMSGVGKAIGGVVSGLFGGSTQQGTATTTQNQSGRSVTQLDPMLRPYVEFGLGEARRLYETQAPQYFPGQTFVSPSQATLSALQSAEQRAIAGSPFTRQAQEQISRTARGEFLQGNPFFQGAFQPAARQAQQAFTESIQDIASKAASSGRYGSSAMNQLQGKASDIFSRNLTETAGKLAFENYAQERARQEAATRALPELAELDYADIERLANVGQAREAYDLQALQDQISRFNYAQNLPQVRLQSYLSSIYGAPAGGITETTGTGTAAQPIYGNPAQSFLGNALSLVGLGQATGIGRRLGGLLGL
jgi:hypothetical protein